MAEAIRSYEVVDGISCQTCGWRRSCLSCLKYRYEGGGWKHEDTIMFIFWKPCSRVYGAGLETGGRDWGLNHGDAFFHSPHKSWHGAKHVVGLQEKLLDGLEQKLLFCLASNFPWFTCFTIYRLVSCRFDHFPPNYILPSVEFLNHVCHGINTASLLKACRANVIVIKEILKGISLKLHEKLPLKCCPLPPKNGLCAEG